jgi:hypothetical protein
MRTALITDLLDVISTLYGAECDDAELVELRTKIR